VAAKKASVWQRREGCGDVLQNFCFAGWISFFGNRFMPNGPALTIVRVCALFHCPPLNNFTKIKLSQQTTKPPHFC